MRHTATTPERQHKIRKLSAALQPQHIILALQQRRPDFSFLIGFAMLRSFSTFPHGKEYAVPPSVRITQGWGNGACRP